MCCTVDGRVAIKYIEETFFVVFDQWESERDDRELRMDSEVESQFDWQFFISVELVWVNVSSQKRVIDLFRKRNVSGATTTSMRRSFECNFCCSASERETLRNELRKWKRSSLPHETEKKKQNRLSVLSDLPLCRLAHWQSIHEMLTMERIHKLVHFAAARSNCLAKQEINFLVNFNYRKRVNNNLKMLHDSLFFLLSSTRDLTSLLTFFFLLLLSLQ